VSAHGEAVAPGRSPSLTVPNKEQGMSTKSKGGIYTRHQGGAARYYARIGGQRVRLVPSDEKRATTDPEVARALYAHLVMEHQKAKLRTIHGLPSVALPLFTAAEEHLKLKAAAGRVRTQTIEADELNLERACAYFGADTLLEAITPQQVGAWAGTLAGQPRRAAAPHGNAARQTPTAGDGAVQRAEVPQLIEQFVSARAGAGLGQPGCEPGRRTDEQTAGQAARVALVRGARDRVVAGIRAHPAAQAV
jgi:hypothetical protein